MQFWIINRGKKDTDKATGPASLTDLGYSSATTIEMFPHKRSLFQAAKCNEPNVVGSSFRVLANHGENIEIIISRIYNIA